MNIAAMETAIRARLLADTGSGGLRAASSPLVAADNKITSVMGITATTTFPYIVIVIASNNNTDTFTASVIEYTVEIHIFGKTEDGNAVPSSIIDRVVGDWSLQSTRVPSYGLDRHQLSLTSPWVGGIVQRTGGSTAHDRDLLEYIESFKVNATRVAP